MTTNIPPSTQQTHWQDMSSKIILLALICMIFLFSIAPKFIAPLICLFSLIVLLLNYKKIQFSCFFSFPLFTLSAMFVLSLFLFLSFNLSSTSTFQLFKSIGLVLPFLILINLSGGFSAQNKKMFSLVPVVYFASLVLCVLQFETGVSIKYYFGLSLENGSVRDFNDFLMSNTVFLWFSMLCSIIQPSRFLRWLNFINFLVLIFLIVNNQSETSLICFVLSSAGFFGYFLMRDQLSNYIKLGLLLSMLMIYFLPGYVVNSGVDSELTNNIENFLGESALHRIDIWQRNIELIKKRPLTGWGTSDGNELPKTEKASFFNKLIKRDEFRHPHNMFLQITLELGLLGLLLFIFLLNYLLNKISNLNPSFRPYLYASFISFSCVWLVSGTVWRSWWLVYLSMFVFAVVLINNSFEYEDEPLS